MIAQTTFELNAERSPLTYQWEGHGLKLQLPEGATASFNIRAVQSSKFELPKGTELVSMVYWVSCKGEVGGQVGVELQHCAMVGEIGKRSGLRFAVCKMEEAEPPFQFELCEGHFSSRSSYGRLEVEFSDKSVAVVSDKSLAADHMFLTKLYYQQQHQLLSTIAHFVMVPQLDIYKVGI